MSCYAPNEWLEERYIARDACLRIDDDDDDDGGDD